MAELNGSNRAIKITKQDAVIQNNKKLKVAIYARVSSDRDTAFHSLEAQKDYFVRMVKGNDKYELCGVYADEAISGTTKDRPEFLRLIRDARDGLIDMIVTKSITRFARNTVMLLETVRELRELNVDVFFEKENLHSNSPDGELLITLLAMYAEEEARSASQNQRWRIKKKFSQGETTTGRMLGYRLVDGKLVIAPKEAELVKYIFDEYLGGKSVNQIVRKLNKDKVPARFSDVWNRSSIIYILGNEKYTGNMLLQKVYTPDFRTKKRVKNDNLVPKYYVENSHEAIISMEDFEKVQVMLKEASKKCFTNKCGKSNRSEGDSDKNNNDKALKAPEEIETNLFTGLLLCGVCGHGYGRFNNNRGKYKKNVWQCYRYSELGKDYCSSKAIPEDILKEVTEEVIREFIKESQKRLKASGRGRRNKKKIELEGSSSPTNPFSGLNNATLKEYLDSIIVMPGNRLIYKFKNGEEIIKAWKHRSRSESWTKEMREEARKRALEQHAKRKKGGKK